MPKVEKKEASPCLKKGALGIGEEHSEPHGRQLVLELFKSGDVKHFFVEHSMQYYGNLLKSAQERAAKGMNVEALTVKSFDGAYNPTHPLSVVIATALYAKIPVYFADNSSMAFRPKQHQKRHTTIRDTYKQVVGHTNAVSPESIGCLLLWGGAHFEGPEALDNYIKGLPFIKMG